MTDARRLVDKLWSYCNVLRDDGVSTIDYVEQLTYLLFLMMAHEREQRPVKPERVVPPECSWQRLLGADGDELEVRYRHVLEDLGKQPGVLGVVFRKAPNKVQDPAKLKRLVVDLIDKQNWSATGVDIKGDTDEELLAKGAEDVKSEAGKYFTPRALISAMVHCVQPTAADTVIDPACGTGGFLLEAARHPLAAGRRLGRQPGIEPQRRRGRRSGSVGRRQPGLRRQRCRGIRQRRARSGLDGSGAAGRAAFARRLPRSRPAAAPTDWSRWQP